MGITVTIQSGADRRIKKRWKVQLCTVASLFFLVLTGSTHNAMASDSSGRIAIKVNRVSISRRQLEKAFISIYLNPTTDHETDPRKLWDQIVDEAIEEELLSQQTNMLMSRINPDAMENLVRDRRQIAIEINGGRKKWEQSLGEWGITADDWELIVRKKLTTYYWIAWQAKLTTIGPDEIKKYYQAHMDEFKSSDRYRIARIDIATGALKPDRENDGDPINYYMGDDAQNFLAHIQKKLLEMEKQADSDMMPEFTKYARNISTGDDAKHGGRMLSPLERDTWEIDELTTQDQTVLATLTQEKSLSDVYISSGESESENKTYSLMKLVERIEGSQMDFDQAAPFIAENLRKKQFKEIRVKIFEELLKNATITRMATEYPSEIVSRLSEKR